MKLPSEHSTKSIRLVCITQSSCGVAIGFAGVDGEDAKWDTNPVKESECIMWPIFKFFKQRL